MSSDVDEPVTNREEKSMIVEDGQKAVSEEKPVDKNKRQLNISSTTLPNNVTDLVPNDVTDLVPNDFNDLVVRYLHSRRLEDDIKSEEVVLTLWDFAGQRLYYASHSVSVWASSLHLSV